MDQVDRVDQLNQVDEPRPGAARRAPTHAPIDHAALLDQARAEHERVVAEESNLGLFRLPRSRPLAMIVAVREAAAAGFTDQAIAACMDTIDPILDAMSGSDFFAVGPRRDLAAIERSLRARDVERAVEIIRSLSRLRWWVSVSGMVFVCVVTLLFWLMRQ
jgi:hypothetical protein